MPGTPPDPEKKEKILQSAIELFVEKGYSETTTLAISRRAKMSSSHMYIYFADKEALLVAAVLRMKDEHTGLSTQIASKCAGLSDEGFFDLFFEAQATIYNRVRFIMHCTLSPGLAHLFDGIDFDFSGVFIPFLKDFPDKLAADTARVLASIAAGYFFTGDMNRSKAASLSALKGARASLANDV